MKLRALWSLGGLLALLAGTASAQDAEDAPTYLAKILVEKEGLKFTAPCSATVFAVGRGQDPLAPMVDMIDAELGTTLPSGDYQALLACPSTEGELRQTVGFRVRGKPVSVPVKLKPAFLLVNVSRNGVEVPASITIVDEHGRVLVEGRDKVAHPVPAGKLTARAVVDKKAAGRRKPVRGDVVARTTAGQKTTALIDTSDGRMLLTLTANGRKVEGVGGLRKRGSLERLVEVTAGEEIEVPPGTYDLVTSLFESHDYHELITRDVSVQPGKLRRVKVNHAVGAVTPDVRLDGKPLPAGTKAEVDLYLGEAIKPFNTIAVDEKATLKPGKFRMVARMTKRKLDDRSPWNVETSVNVRAGSNNKARLELAPARLEVVTTLGKEPATTRAMVFLPEGTAPVAKKKAAGAKAVTFQLPAGKYLIRSGKKTPHGRHVVEKDVTLKKGRTTKVSLDHDLGRAMVQVFDKGVAVPAEVSFVADGAASATVRIKAGKEAFLPPGSYTLIVHRGGKEQTFSAIKVAAGRKLERQVEFAVNASAARADPEPDRDPEPDDDPVLP